MTKPTEVLLVAAAAVLVLAIIYFYVIADRKKGAKDTASVSPPSSSLYASPRPSPAALCSSQPPPAGVTPEEHLCNNLFANFPDQVGPCKAAATMLKNDYPEGGTIREMAQYGSQVTDAVTKLDPAKTAAAIQQVPCLAEGRNDCYASAQDKQLADSVGSSMLQGMNWARKFAAAVPVCSTPGPNMMSMMLDSPVPSPSQNSYGSDLVTRAVPQGPPASSMVSSAGVPTTMRKYTESAAGRSAKVI